MGAAPAIVGQTLAQFWRVFGSNPHCQTKSALLPGPFAQSSTGSRSWRSWGESRQFLCLLCIRIDQVSDFRLGGNVAGQAALQFAVCLCLPFVLTQMFCPRINQEYLQV